MIAMTAATTGRGRRSAPPRGRTSHRPKYRNASEDRTRHVIRTFTARVATSAEELANTQSASPQSAMRRLAAVKAFSGAVRRPRSHGITAIRNQTTVVPTERFRMMGLRNSTIHVHPIACVRSGPVSGWASRPKPQPDRPLGVAAYGSKGPLERSNVFNRERYFLFFLAGGHVHRDIFTHGASAPSGGPWGRKASSSWRCVFWDWDWRPSSPRTISP